MKASTWATIFLTLLQGCAFAAITWKRNLCYISAELNGCNDPESILFSETFEELGSCLSLGP
eukprot:5908074-Amphidinium_carterae.1